MRGLLVLTLALGACIGDPEKPAFDAGQGAETSADAETGPDATPDPRRPDAGPEVDSGPAGCETREVPGANPCLVWRSDGASGCVLTVADPGTACDDGDACTEEDRCTPLGRCVGRTAWCDDLNPCTSNVCDPGTGCVHEPLTGAPCDDGSECTLADACEAGKCVGADKNPACSCLSDTDCARYVHNRCAGELTCLVSENVCVVDIGKAVSCAGEGNTPCLYEACDPATGGCGPTNGAAGSPCDDGNPCTPSDVCDGEGACGGDALSCEDGDACTADLCAWTEQGVQCVNLSTQCECASDADCAPVGAGCLATACVAGGCVLAPLPDGPVDDCDGNACTTDDRCLGGTCVVTEAPCPCEGDAECADLDQAASCVDPSSCVGQRVEGVCQNGGCVAMQVDAPEACLGEVCAEAGCSDATHYSTAGTCDGAGSCGAEESSCTLGLPECAVGSCAEGVGCVVDASGCAGPCAATGECPAGFECDADSGACVSPGDTVLVPAGSFVMGCEAPADNCHDTSQPERTVFVSAFEIDRLEVTVAAYQACMDVDGCSAPDLATGTLTKGDPTLPISGVTRDQAQYFCSTRGEGWRLPTEAEWEKAARGPDGQIYPWGDDLKGLGACSWGNNPNCEFKAVPVGLYPQGASPYGAQDMVGNLAEWVYDWYSAQYWKDEPTPDGWQDPMGPPQPTLAFRMAKGAAYLPINDLEAWDRAQSSENNGSGTIGFRCARQL